VPTLPGEVRARLARAVEAVDVNPTACIDALRKAPRKWNYAVKPLPETPELLAVAERVVWFKPPAEALAGPVHFLAHVMTYGTVEDLRALNGVVGPNEAPGPASRLACCSSAGQAALRLRPAAGFQREPVAIQAQFVAPKQHTPSSRFS